MRLQRILILGALILGLLQASQGAALETVHWDDLSKNIPQLCDCDYTVVATSGEKYTGKSLTFKTSEISIPDANATVRRESVAEIQIRHSRETYHAAEERKDRYDQACGHDEVRKCGASAVVVAPLAVTETAVGSVLTEAGNIFNRLRGVKVIRVTP